MWHRSWDLIMRQTPDFVLCYCTSTCLYSMSTFSTIGQHVGQVTHLISKSQKIKNLKKLVPIVVVHSRLTLLLFIEHHIIKFGVCVQFTEDKKEFLHWTVPDIHWRRILAHFLLCVYLNGCLHSPTLISVDCCTMLQTFWNRAGCMLYGVCVERLFLHDCLSTPCCSSCAYLETVETQIWTKREETLHRSVDFPSWLLFHRHRVHVNHFWSA